MTANGSAAAAYAVPLDGFVMHIRPSELAAVAAGLRGTGMLANANPASLADALQRMPSLDRAPVWELSLRHLGRAKPLEQAASEIGMDLVHAQDLLARLTDELTAA